MHRKREEKRKKQATIRQQLKDKYGMSWTWDDDDDDIDDNTSYSEDSEWDDLWQNKSEEIQIKYMWLFLCVQSEWVIHKLIKKDPMLCYQIFLPP